VGRRPQTWTHDRLRSFLANWSWHLRYFPLFAAVPAITATATEPARTVDNTKVAPHVAGRAARIAAAVQGCSRPELLRRQSEYRLPHQRKGTDIVSVFAGNDGCPGKAVQPGNYTAAAPYSDSGDTTGANDTVSNNSCFYCYYCYSTSGGPDHVYTFVISSMGANPKITLSTSSSAYNPQIYVLNGLWGPCPTGSYAYNCRVASDQSGPGGSEVIQGDYLRELPLNVPLHLFVDSYFATGTASAGPYTLKIEDMTIAPMRKGKFDFNYTGRTDISVMRPSDNTWYISRPGAYFETAHFGAPGDLPAPADFDGDGKTDIAVFRPSENRWYVRATTAGYYTVPWGVPGDIPVPADYDNDGKADIAVFRPSNGTWYAIGTREGLSARTFGVNGDRPLPMDYDGDGKIELAVRRPSTNEWYIKLPYIDPFGYIVINWGQAGDLSVPADYNGDGYTDIAVFRPSTGLWDIRESNGPDFSPIWGQAGDIPVPGDYDGDYKDDIAVFRPSTGTWYIYSLRAGIIVTTFGQAGDVPVPSVFNY
jgi:hypothetical protein